MRKYERCKLVLIDWEQSVGCIFHRGLDTGSRALWEDRWRRTGREHIPIRGFLSSGRFVLNICCIMKWKRFFSKQPDNVFALSTCLLHRHGWFRSETVKGGGRACVKPFYRSFRPYVRRPTRHTSERESMYECACPRMRSHLRRSDLKYAERWRARSRVASERKCCRISHWKHQGHQETFF